MRTLLSIWFECYLSIFSLHNENDKAYKAQQETAVPKGRCVMPLYVQIITSSLPSTGRFFYVKNVSKPF